MIGDKKLIEEKCRELGFKLIDLGFDYDKNRDAKFEVECLKCGRRSTKTFVTLVKLGSRCRYCTKPNRVYHNSLGEVMPKILDACEKCDYTFISFDGEWEKCRDSKIIVKCNKCGKVAKKNYDNLVNKLSKCVCHRYERLHDTNVLSQEKVAKKIQSLCDMYGFTFLRFLSIDGKYHNNKTVLEVRCNKCNEILTYDFNHFSNNKFLKCKYCEKSVLESCLEKKLIKEGIVFEAQKKFDWLTNKKSLSLDFYLPKHNTAIECQGIQHFKSVEYFGGKEAFIEQVKRDYVKLRLCLEHNINMVYVKSLDDIEHLKIIEE